MNTTAIHPALASIPAVEILDARDIPCRTKHPLILERADLLSVGASFVLVNGHAPEPLRYQFEALFPGCFVWDYLVNEDDFAAVRITRRAANSAGAPSLASAALPGGYGGHS
ncbi:MAG: DUF2249 domain-containing protein [candidate division Zixibacteria bacterium]|nr:DUF2249 domain-containing protein [candidate division Zixibacteria bacterium]